MSVLEWSNVALWMFTALHATLTIAILRYLAVRSGFRRSISIGDIVADTEPVNANGASVRLRASGSVEQRAILFLSTSCPLCRQVVRAAREEITTTHSATEAVFVIAAGPADASRFAQDNGIDLDLTIADPNGQIGKAWRIGEKPFMVVVDRDGNVVSCGKPRGHEEVRDLLTSVTQPGTGGWKNDELVEDSAHRK